MSLPEHSNSITVGSEKCNMAESPNRGGILHFMNNFEIFLKNETNNQLKKFMKTHINSGRKLIKEFKT